MDGVPVFICNTSLILEVEVEAKRTRVPDALWQLRPENLVIGLNVQQLILPKLLNRLV